ncbi:TrkA family potassium uptake protein [Mycoplasma anserisalpingitidis]|uniref:TrkA family potassium uptake protein n=1 Tax=Mycoplasma anserisalpingitidis TaxID=519450 RepID=A0A5B8JXD5_9MOLU|nr:TrkA family potassium uptake protein [Mycoplasma anserisalpingitidis]QDY86900.1 TrkA family potassium uptake protein [Mycoplasma anserisalpingitidis]
MVIKHKKDICVIGLGRFGQAVVSQLLKMNKSVFIIDAKEDNAKIFENEVQRIVIADAADMKALKSMNIEQMETVVVACPDNIEIVAALLELNIKNIIARATSARHARVLKQIGVTQIIRPEHESGIRTALIAANENLIRFSENLQELSENFVVGTTTIKNPDLSKMKIKDLDFNKRKITIILIKRNGSVLRPSGDVELEIDDIVSLVGEVSDVTAGLGWLNQQSK